jgi:hypothetical protein
MACIFRKNTIMKRLLLCLLLVQGHSQLKILPQPMFEPKEQTEAITLPEEPIKKLEDQNLFVRQLEQFLDQSQKVIPAPAKEELTLAPTVATKEEPHKPQMKQFKKISKSKDEQPPPPPTVTAKEEPPKNKPQMKQLKKISQAKDEQPKKEKKVIAEAPKQEPPPVETKQTHSLRKAAPQKPIEAPPGFEFSEAPQ